MEAQLATTLNEWCLSNTHAHLIPHHDPIAITNRNEIHCVNSTSLERNVESTDAISIPWRQPRHQRAQDHVHRVPTTQENVLEITPSPLSLPPTLYSTETALSSFSTLPFTRTSTSTSTSINNGIDTNTVLNTSTSTASPSRNHPKRGRPRFDLTCTQHTNDPSRAARLAKGRLAARKHREKHVQKVELLQDLYTRYAGRNEELKSEVGALREELLGLKGAVLRHAGCGFCPIEKYIAGKMLQFVES